MRSIRLLKVIALGVLGVVLLAGTAFCEDSRAEIRDLAGRIDEIIHRRLAAEGVPPAERADDAEFFRRASLDLCGRIPPAAEIREFLASDDPLKREAAVDRMLRSSTHVIHATNQWRRVLLPEADADVEVRFFLPGFEAWLRTRVASNEPLDRIATELLTLPVEANAMQGFTQPTEPSPLAFYRAKQSKPENLASATARVFLGLRIDCAQCHHHPFDTWKQEQFWSFAAFFQDAAATPNGKTLDVKSIRVAETEATVPALFLDGTTPKWTSESTGRGEVSRWVISGENPYFARAAANRIWANLFGRGIVEPVDDFSQGNAPSHPELLDFLADELRKHGYDQQFLIRVLTSTEAYNRTSRVADPKQEAPELLARMPVRALTPEELFDSLAQATGYRQPFDPEQPVNFNADQTRQEFLETFSAEGRGSYEPQSTILQALTLMNGRFVADATSLSESKTLAAVVDAPFLSPSGKIDALFLTTLSRLPTEKERGRLLRVVEKHPDPPRAYADIFWTLMNTTEFSVNH
jgi:hypothetical protein